MALSAAAVTSRMTAVSDVAHVDAARRAAVRTAAEVNGDEDLLGRITVVVQEMARNLVHHAGAGEVLVSRDHEQLVIVASDDGPGMANVGQCLSDSFSSRGTMGVGLGAIRRMSDAFDIHSQPAKGTLVYAGFSLGAAPLSPSHAAICSPHPAEEVCGDSWAFCGHRAMVCDGLGHGPAAHDASRRARDLFLQHDPQESMPRLMERMHQALSSTRGGALAFAEMNPQLKQVSFCGVGNIAGVLLGERMRSMVSSNGTIGYKMGRVQVFTYPWDESNVLVMASDGIASKFSIADLPGILNRHPALIAAAIHRGFRRHNDDATVLVVKP